MPEAVLFDLDGVLVHSAEAWFRTMVATAKGLGCPPPARAAFYRTFGQGIEVDAEQFYGGRDPEEVAAAYARHYPAHLGAVEVDPAALRVLAAVREQGLGTAIVTNSPRPVAEAVLERHGLAVDVLVTATDVPQEKPAPDEVLAACAGLGVVPAAALLVGDTVTDRAAARAAEVEFAGLRVEGDHRLPDLDALPGLVDRLRGEG